MTLDLSEQNETVLLNEVKTLYHTPFLELVYQAATIHRQYHDPSEVQLCTLLSVKTGGCSEDCSYCPQAARYHTDIEKQKFSTTNFEGWLQGLESIIELLFMTTLT